MLPYFPLEILGKDTFPTQSSIQEIINGIIAACGPKVFKTVDTVKSGDPSVACSGIVCTFLATTEVIKQSIDKGANLIITHEPTYYNHWDETGWLENDPVYRYKRELLENNKVVVWRFHDYWHRHTPDGILTGFLQTMGWEAYLDTEREVTCVLPAHTLIEYTQMLQKGLGLKRAFYVGDPSMQATTLALLPGAWGRDAQIKQLRREDIDIAVVGEVAEWETCEWVRDAVSAGMKKGLIILGHADSEEPGMRYLVDWLKPRVDDIPVWHVPAGDPFVGV
ncbi:MAG: Nif3-like dinuclear metal center hexameric protein [Bacteroidota bacterium]